MGSQLQGDNEKLSKTIAGLEATILQLDGDLNASKADINKHKLHGDELEDGLNKANEEKEVIKKHVIEMEEVLKSFAGKSDNRRKLRKSKDEGNSEAITIEALQTSSKLASDHKVLNEVIQILEEERVELEHQIEKALQEKNDVME